MSYRIFISLDAKAVGQVPPPKDPFTDDDDDGPPDGSGPPGLLTGTADDSSF